MEIANAAILAVLLVAGYLLALTVHRLYLSPIAHIPGPKLAALSYYYQSYYDLFPHHGQFLFHCGELHQKYGPVVRIGPDEVHVNDVRFYKKMYGSSTQRRNKSPIWYWMAGLGVVGDDSMFITLGHDLHRLRRAGLGTYFSKRKVQELEPRIKDKVLLLRKRLLEHAGTGETVNLKDAFGGMSLDIITQYCFGNCIGALDRPDLGREWNQLMGIGLKINPFARAFPTIARLLVSLPKWMTSRSKDMDGLTEFLDLANNLSRQARDEAIAEIASGKVSQKTSNNADADDAESRTVLHSMMRSDVLPEREKTFSRLAADGMTLIAAGFDTTSRTLTVTVFHLLSRPEIHQRVLAELRTVMPTPQSPLPPVSQLEKLPYLTSVIHEGTRLAHGVAGRLVRIAPDEDLHHSSAKDGKVYTIPRGTTFSQSSYLVHTDPDFYPDPHSFDPERYLHSPDSPMTDAQRYLVPFGKGTRACAGINLAFAELYLTLAAIVGTLDLRLSRETTERDVTLTKELFVGVLPERPGVLVDVVGELGA